MFPGMFWIKYLFRVMHIGSLVLICQSVITAKMTGHPPAGHRILFMLSGIFVIISGIVNIYLLKPKEMGQKRKLWVAYNHLKALTAIILFSPLVKVLPITPQGKIDIQFYWMIVVLLLSPFARFYREHFVAQEKQKKQRQIREEDNSA